MKEYKKGLFAIIVILCILCIFSYFLPFLSYQEAKRATIIKEAYNGNFFYPTFDGNPYFNKPPLYTWLALPFFGIGKTFLREVFFLRLLSLLSYMCMGYIIYLISHKKTSLTILSLLILFSSFRFLSFCFRIDLEPIFVLFVVLGIYFLQKYRETLLNFWAYSFYLQFGLAFLIRGPLYFFLYPALFIYAFFKKDKTLIRLLIFPQGWLLFIGIIIPWYLIGYLKFGSIVFEEFLKSDIGERLFLKKDPFYHYLLALFLNFIPYFFLIFLKSKILFQNSSKIFSEESLFYLSLFVIPLILLSFTGEKFDKYLLFIYPFVALFLSEILSKLYNLRFLIFLSTILMILNALAIILIKASTLKDLKFKEQIFIKQISCVQNLYFYQKINPLVIYYFDKPIPLIKNEEELNIHLKNGNPVLVPFKIKGYTPKFILPDPFKKNKFWYLY
ncbi:MAG: glycosyltransferase family 39 protein [candidate division WOR-3 bacterium]